MSNIKTYKKVGTLEINSGRIDITDPCYDADVWCRMNNVEIKAGIYDCYVLLGGSKGRRVDAMAIVHQDANLDTPIDIDDMQAIDYVCVDAGLMSISEAGTKPDYTDEEWEKICHYLFDKRTSGPTVLVTSQLTFRHDKQMFWATSGDGDGSYDVFVINTHDRKNAKAVPDMIEIFF